MKIQRRIRKRDWELFASRYLVVSADISHLSTPCIGRSKGLVYDKAHWHAFSAILPIFWKECPVIPDLSFVSGELSIGLIQRKQQEYSVLYTQRLWCCPATCFSEKSSLSDLLKSDIALCSFIPVVSKGWSAGMDVPTRRLGALPLYWSMWYTWSTSSGLPMMQEMLERMPKYQEKSNLT